MRIIKLAIIPFFLSIFYSGFSYSHTVLGNCNYDSTEHLGKTHWSSGEFQNELYNICYFPHHEQPEPDPEPESGPYGFCVPDSDPDAPACPAGLLASCESNHPDSDCFIVDNPDGSTPDSIWVDYGPSGSGGEGGGTDGGGDSTGGDAGDGGGGDTGSDTGGGSGGDTGSDTGGGSGGDTGTDTGGDSGGDTGSDTGGGTVGGGSGGDTGSDTGEGGGVLIGGTGDDEESVEGSISGGQTCSAPPTRSGDVSDAEFNQILQTYYLRCPPDSGDDPKEYKPDGFDADKLSEKVIAKQTEYTDFIADIKQQAESLFSIGLGSSGHITKDIVSIRGADVDFSLFRFMAELSIIGQLIIALAYIRAFFIITSSEK